MPRTPKRPAGLPRGMAAGQSGNGRASKSDARRAGAAGSRLKILLKKDREHADRLARAAAYVPAPDSLQASLLAAAPENVAAVLTSGLLTPGRACVGRSDDSKYKAAQLIAQATEAYQHATDEVRLGMLASLGAEQPIDPKRVQRVFIDSVIEVPERTSAGERAFNNARNLRYTMDAGLKGLQLADVAPDHVLEALRVRYGGLSAYAGDKRSVGRELRAAEVITVPSPNSEAEQGISGDTAGELESSGRSGNAEVYETAAKADQEEDLASEPASSKALDADLTIHSVKLALPNELCDLFKDDFKVLCVVSGDDQGALVRDAVPLGRSTDEHARYQFEKLLSRRRSSKIDSAIDDKGDLDNEEWI